MDRSGGSSRSSTRNGNIERSREIDIRDEEWIITWELYLAAFPETPGEASLSRPALPRAQPLFLAAAVRFELT